jgi:hypothetical protein
MSAAPPVLFRYIGHVSEFARVVIEWFCADKPSGHSFFRQPERTCDDRQDGRN